MLCKGLVQNYGISHIYKAYMDYMDLAVCCSRKAVKLNSLTHSHIYVPADGC